MYIRHVPLLHVQRELQGMPRDMARFRQYLRVMLNEDGSDLEYPPLGLMNPMGREHVTALLDDLLTFDAEGLAARTLAEAEAELVKEPGEFRASLVVVDDLKGGWTNRYACEYGLRRLVPPTELTPRQAKRFWITAVLWSSEEASERRVQEALRTAVYRVAYVQRHGVARTLRDLLAQEGAVMARAGCTGPVLADDEVEYTRTVLAPFLDAEDMRTSIECLFGDEAAASLGFTPRGLSPWAGLALALHDARCAQPFTGTPILT